MNIQNAHISRQAELFEMQQMIDDAKKHGDNLALDYVNNAKYIERLEAEKRSMRG